MKGVNADRKEENKVRTEPEILWRRPYKRSTAEDGVLKHFQQRLGRSGQRGRRKNQERVVFWKPWGENISTGNECSPVKYALNRLKMKRENGLLGLALFRS